MSAEQRPGITRVLGTALDFAYSELGDQSGQDVTEEQISAVLHGELRLFKTSWLSNLSPDFYQDEKFLKEALGFHTNSGLRNASIFMFTMADHWREVAHKEKESDPDSEAYSEAQRRALACKSSRDFIDQMHLRV